MHSLSSVCAGVLACFVIAPAGASTYADAAVPLAMQQAVAPGAAAPDSSAMTDDEQAADQARMNEVVCQRQAVIGSRVASRRVCMTRREWARAQGTARDEVGRFVQDSTAGAGRGQ